MRFIIILSVFLLTASNANAFQVNDTIRVKADSTVERITRDLDSLVHTWYVKMAFVNNPVKFNDDTLQLQIADTVYESRLKKINSVINLPFNSIIKSHIEVYTIRQREQFCAVLGLKDYYFPMIENIFDSYGIPVELKYMAVIESALNPGVVNRRSGATGMWQFMYSTGKMYGLTINSIVDERKDPMKSTVAAARYLKDLYSIYNDWVLVIAAYNCGPGIVNRAIYRSGNKKDYWEIFWKLPRETRGYIPQYVAAAYGVTYYNEHGLHPIPLNIPVATDTIMVNQDIHLSQISSVMRIPLPELKALNPSYRTGLIPGASKPQILTLPVNHLGDFISLNDTIINYKSDVYLNKATRIPDPTRSTYAPADIKGKTKLIYTVEDGDNLGFIAEWYKVSVADLRDWNNLYRNLIRVGQKLAVYVEPSRAEALTKVSSMSFEAKQKMVGKTTPATSVPAGQIAQAIVPSSSDGEYITYTVREGDTIWDIVRMFDNVTTTQVLSINNIPSADRIQVGQKLKIKKKS
jgi:membrane-bound lytic murein transglycosylase D